jgi:hypothetical protein
MLDSTLTKCWPSQMQLIRRTVCTLLDDNKKLIEKLKIEPSHLCRITKLLGNKTFTCSMCDYRWGFGLVNGFIVPL